MILSILEVTNYGTEYWYLNKCFHRQNKPAITENHPGGYIYFQWYENGKRYREYGFAFVLGNSA